MRSGTRTKMAPAVGEGKGDFIEDFDNNNLLSSQGDEYYTGSGDSSAMGLSSCWTVSSNNLFGKLSKARRQSLESIIKNRAQIEFELNEEQSEILLLHLKKYGFTQMEKLVNDLSFEVVKEIVKRARNVYNSMINSDCNFSISIAVQECRQCQEDNPDIACCRNCKLFDLKQQAFANEFSRYHPCFNCSRFNVTCTGIDSAVVNDITTDDVVEDINTLYSFIDKDYYIIIETLKEIGIKKVNPRLKRAIKKQVSRYENKSYSIYQVAKDSSPQSVISVLDNISNQIYKELQLGSDIFGEIKEDVDVVYKLEKTNYGYRILKDGIQIADIINETICVYTTTDDLIPLRGKIDFSNYRIKPKGTNVNCL